MIKLEHNGSLFSFERDQLGHGDWVILKGKCPGLIGTVTPNVIVPLLFARELTQVAIQKGLGSPEKFASVIVKPKVQRVSLSPRKKTINIKGAFNPFKMSFFPELEENESDDPEYDVVDELKEMELES